eukprot:gb/GECG01000419.1/.p1 GENE.gb/GECG01000419.1/~~gb/GECG01000419.1/.p1  ORF type:complete len:506 (+),score=50.80 gb/GECG01000419.1/:1-1518(+)
MSSGGNNWDLDEIFSFKTPRFVRIRDRRLGIMNWLFSAGIFAYIVGYLVLWQQGFNEKGDAIGVSRPTLREPSDDLTRNPGELVYCGEGNYTADVKNAVQAPRRECQYLDMFSAQYPRQQTDAIFLSTRIAHELYERNSSVECHNMTNPSPQCRFQKTAETTFYVAEPEWYTLLIDHSVIVPDFEWSATGWGLHGRLLDTQGNVVDPCRAYGKRGVACPDYIHIGKPNEYDVMPMMTLLEAAGIDSLDSAAGDVGVIQTETLRVSGMALLVEVAYDNFFTYNPDNVRYTLKAHKIQNTEFKIEQPLSSFARGSAEKLVYNRHGIQVVVRQTGKIGRFNFAQLLTVLVTSLGLIAVSASIVNFTAFSLLPMRYIYRQYREVKSVDYSDIRDIPESQINRFKREDLLNPKPKVFADTSEGDSALLAGGTSPKSAQVNRKAPKESGEDHLPYEPVETTMDGPRTSIEGPLSRVNPLSKVQHASDGSGGNAEVPTLRDRVAEIEMQERK